MHKAAFRHIAKNLGRRTTLIVITSASTAVIGTGLLLLTKASPSLPPAATSVAIEAESAAQSSLAKTEDSPLASGNKLVRFTDPDPSGEAMPSGDLPGWRLIFSDNFANDVPLGSFPDMVSTRWKNGGSECSGDTTGKGVMAPSKTVSINNGLLDIFLHTTTVAGCEGKTINGVPINGTAKPHVASPQPILPGNTQGNGQLYGRYSLRFKAVSNDSQKLNGFKAVPLLWPTSGEKLRDGEIDFPEGDFIYDNLQPFEFKAFVHKRGAEQVPPFAAAYRSGHTFLDGWHTAIIEWLPTRLTFFLDDRKIGEYTDLAGIPNTPMRYSIKTETELPATDPLPRPSTSGHFQVDWVAVYARAN